MAVDNDTQTRDIVERRLTKKNVVFVSNCSLISRVNEASMEGIKSDPVLSSSRGILFKVEHLLISGPANGEPQKVLNQSTTTILSRNSFFLKTIFKMRKNVGKRKTDLVHIHFSFSHFWMILGILAVPGPQVISVETDGEEFFDKASYASLIWRIVFRLVSSKTKVFLCYDHAMLQSLKKKFGISRKKILLVKIMASREGDRGEQNNSELSDSLNFQKTPLSFVDVARTLYREMNFQKERRGLNLFRGVVGRLFSRKSPPSGILRVLMYHRISDTLDSDILAVTPFAFAQQMMWLREEGWTVLPVREALLRLEKGSLPPRAAAITFDDGYRDNYDEVFPILLRQGFPATIFPVTGFVLGESEHRRYRGHYPWVPYLTVEQIREMKGAGIDFGGHTHTHPHLTTISIEEATEEISRAKKLLDEWTGEKTTLFAYPNGLYSRDHFRILDGLGYEAAFSVRPGANRAGTLRWVLRRTEISGRDSLGDFIHKMNGGLDVWHNLYQGVRGFYR